MECHGLMQHTIRSDDMMLPLQDKMRLLLLFILLGALSSGAKQHSARKDKNISAMKVKMLRSLDSRVRKDLREMKNEIKQLGTDHISMIHSMDYFKEIIRQGWGKNPTEFDRGRRRGKGVSGK